MNQVTTCTVAPFVSGSVNARDPLQLERSLQGGRDLGVLDASGESLTLLFVLVVLVDDSDAEETAEVTRVRR